MIRVENLSFSYDGKQNIFTDVSFEVKRGEIMAVLGANGIGKTTMMRCIMKFLHPQSGKIYIAGEDTENMSSSCFWKRVSYVPQAKNLVFGYSVLNMVVMGRSQYVKFGYTPGKEEYERAYRLLEEMGLASFAHRSCNSLSGGVQQGTLAAPRRVGGCLPHGKGNLARPPLARRLRQGETEDYPQETHREVSVAEGRRRAF